MKTLRDERRVWIDSLKDLPCSRCGIKYPPYVMEFHHKDRGKKLFQISRAVNISSKKKILDEIAKCMLLCSNCHKIIEHAKIV